MTPAPPRQCRPRATRPLKVSGEEREGATLTATPGAWSCVTPATTYTYQWLRCDAGGGSCVEIVGAVTPTYAVGAVDVGSRLRVRVSASDPLGGVGGAESAPTGPIQPRAVPAGPLDVLAPTLAVRVRRQRLSDVARRGLAVRVACSESCDIASLLLLDARTARRLKLARSPYPFVVGLGSATASAGPAKLRVTLVTRRVRRALSRLTRVRLTLKTFGLDGARNAGTDTRRITLRR